MKSRRDTGVVVESVSKRAIVFRDREDAGRQLAQCLLEQSFAGDVVVLGLPRGGVPVAYEVARVLGAPLDVFIVRKLGAPFNPELAVGAIASGGVTVYNERVLDQLGIDEEHIGPIRERAEAELRRREQAYRGDRPLPQIKNRTVILVDDGVATGATMRAAVDAVRQLEPRAVMVAVPHAARDSVNALAARADKVVALSIPEPYMAVGAWYQVFPQLSDEEVVELLNRARDASA